MGGTTEDEDALFRASAMAQDLIADWRDRPDTNEPAVTSHTPGGVNTPAVTSHAPSSGAETTADTAQPRDAAVAASETDEPAVATDEADPALAAFAALNPERGFEDVSPEELAAERLSTVSSVDWPAALAQDLHQAAWKDLVPQARKPVKSLSSDTVRLESWVIGPMHARKPVDA